MIAVREVSSKTLPSHEFFERMGMTPMISGSSRSPTSCLNTSVWSSGVSTDFTLEYEFLKLGRPLSRNVSIVQTTSAAVTGVPSENFACLLILKVKVERSSETSILSASSP